MSTPPPAAVLSVAKIDAVRELRLRWIGTPCTQKPMSSSRAT